MNLTRRRTVLLYAGLLAVWSLTTPTPGIAQLPPGLSAGGINGVVGGGPAGGAISIPPPPSSAPSARPGIPTVKPYTPTFGGSRQTYGSGARVLPEGAYVPRRKTRRPHRAHR